MLTVLTETADEYHIYDFPVLFAMIGPPAIPALAAYLHDPEKPLHARITVSGSLGGVALRHPEARRESLASLVGQLARFEENDYGLTSFIVLALTSLKAVEAADTIERAFAADCVERGVCGDWGTVRKKLGVAGLGLVPGERPQYDAQLAAIRHAAEEAERKAGRCRQTPFAARLWHGSGACRPKCPLPVRQREEVQKMLFEETG